MGNELTLSIADRINLGNMLPRQGNSIELTIVRDLQRKIAVGKDEMKKIEMKPNSRGPGIVWKQELAKEKMVKFSESELRLCKRVMDGLDKEGKLDLEQLDLYNKIKDSKMGKTDGEDTKE